MTTRNPTNRPAPTYSGPRTAYGDLRPLDRADLRQRAQSSYRLADVAFRISDATQQKATEEAVANAQREGAKLGGVNSKKVTIMRNGKPTEVDVPTLVRREGSGAVNRAFNQAAEAAYAMRIDTATMQHIQQAALDHPADPDGLRQSLQGWHQGIKDLIPPEFAAKYEHDLYAQAQPLITRAETDLMRNVAADQAIDAKMAADTLVGAMVINSSLPDGGPIAAAQFNNFVDATLARVGPFFSEAEARQEINDVLARAAHGALQATFEGAPNKQAAMDAFQSGKAVVSLPAVGEDGKVHPALYDKNSLIQLVGAEKVQTMVNGLAVDIRMQEAEERARIAEARAAENERLAALQTDIQLGFEDAVAEAEATGKSPMSASEIANAYPGEKNRKTREKLMAKLGIAAQTGSIRKTVATQGPAEDAAFLESLKPKAGDGDFAERAALYNVAVAEVQGKNKALETDPASYVMQTNDTVQQAWETAGSDPAKVQQAVAATKQAQIELGVAPEKVRPMPKAHAAGLASTITTASPDTVAQAIDGISQAYGDDGLNQVIGEGVPPMAKAVAFADDPRYGAWRAKAIEAMKVKESVLKEQAKARGVTESDISDALEGLTVPLQDTLPSGAAQPYVDAVRQVTLFNVANNGMNATDAAADAWSVFQSAYSFNGSYRVPVKWDGDKVASALAGVIARLETYDIRPATVGQTGDLTFDKAETINSLKAGHFRWVTDQTEQGVILTFEEGDPVLLADGTPLRIPFGAAMALPPGGADMLQNLRGLSGTN